MDAQAVSGLQRPVNFSNSTSGRQKKSDPAGCGSLFPTRAGFDYQPVW